MDWQDSNITSLMSIVSLQNPVTHAEIQRLVDAHDFQALSERLNQRKQVLYAQSPWACICAHTNLVQELFSGPLVSSMTASNVCKDLFWNQLGLRAKMQAGFSYMNDVTVIQTSQVGPPEPLT